MEKAKEGGVSTKPFEGVLAKMRNYIPKDAIYIPTGGLYLFQDERSQLMAVTTDGRYTITGGSVMDILQRKSVLSVEDIRKSYFINLDDAPFSLATVASIPLGNPKLKRQAAIFITLDCDGCQDLVKKFYDEREKYRIDIVLIPSPGESKQKLRQLWCSKEKGKVNDLDILRWLMGNKADIEKRLLSKEEAETCPAEPLVGSLMLAGIYKLQGVPSVVRQDGLSGNGIPKDFDYWLKQSVEPLLKNPFETK
ncbi:MULTISPECIES: protein-disulfide isomerase HtdT [Escherichia]|uniref:protein-disulfide isomerase HtdT n=1 Tax=Escherichia TaxID=561 RepID=UPI0016030FA5|nr:MULTISPECIES: protein-disulfide isomerase HtdT [Escherichia]EIK8055596.1 protein-disulfide isomerase HtdT [Escherichia coli]EIY6704498.1 protein-disulfide isomerase HtdT [Escherichia coli]EKR5116901.1 protein-disulfide isomerase HtdT [Escherichia coli]EKR5145283.1 protein-disulfide isomerase HtdT [Escherichia coli]ELD1746263.1 protein-disulfide isomerase HtdT [Escherichia coli]